jgi:hypothetical protein
MRRVTVLKVMADHKLDAIVHKTVEHQPTFIKDGINPPYSSNNGVPTLNTFLVYAGSMTVPSGFTTDNLPVGITFFGRPFSEPTLIKLAYAYEQATHHRCTPKEHTGFAVGTRIAKARITRIAGDRRPSSGDPSGRGCRPLPRAAESPIIR